MFRILEPAFISLGMSENSYMLEIHFYSIWDDLYGTCRLEMRQGLVDIDDCHALDDLLLWKLRFLNHEV